MQTPAMASSDILAGMSQLINVQNVKEGVNYEEIEKMYLNNEKKEEKENNPTESFRDELKELANRLELTFDTPAMPTKPQTPKFKPSPVTRINTPMFSQSKPSFGTPVKEVSFNFDTPAAQSEHYEEEPVSFGGTPARTPITHRNSFADTPRNSFADTPRNSFADTPRNSFADTPRETELERRTNEQIRHDQIKGVMDEMGAQNATIFTLEQTRRQDEKLTMLDEIASLKMSLEEDEAKGIENIPRVDNKSSYEDVESVLKSYRLINDRMRYCSLADEFILWGAQGMEELFNGKRTWFGRYNPDLSGWSKQVSVKLRRMRHETSQLVGGIMHDYNIGPGMRIILELIPNMFMYARTKKQNYGKPTLMNDSEISMAISEIRNYH